MQRALNVASYLEQNCWTSRTSNATRYPSSYCVVDQEITSQVSLPRKWFRGSSVRDVNRQKRVVRHPTFQTGLYSTVSQLTRRPQQQRLSTGLTARRCCWEVWRPSCSASSVERFSRWSGFPATQKFTRRPPSITTSISHPFNHSLRQDSGQTGNNEGPRSYRQDPAFTGRADRDSSLVGEAKDAENRPPNPHTRCHRRYQCQHPSLAEWVSQHPLDCLQWI